MSILLVGYRGSGKTTIGKKLADRLWQPFVDTDDLIVRAAGKSIKEIFAESGEEAFRDLESNALQQALALKDHVISLGGGAVIREQNRELIKNSGHRVIYLRCEPDILHQRIGADPNTAANRPALSPAGGNIDEIRTILSLREPWYRQVMSAELEVTNLSVSDAVVYIIRLL
ncbi:MAG: shikimate kinase [Phycisphaerales bacterium]|jgi:shikimate kinase|nr:shikimate kinase [Phycisphaerales bacterium]